MDQRSRGWVFTLNNYDQADVDRMPSVDSQYLIYGKEVGESGTPHLQGFVYFANARTGKAVKKQISERSHIEKMRGTPKQAADYCRKGGEFVEFGVMPEQGKRSDLHDFKDEINSGTLTISTILEENPLLYHQYGRTIEKMNDNRLRKLTRNHMTKGIWLWGPTGTGKSHRAAHFTEQFGYGSTYYHKMNDKGWWDNYQAEDVVVINEFRGQISFSDMLQLCDKWPYSVPRRGTSPVPFVSKVVIITSDKPPIDIYREQESDQILQLYRRFSIWHVTNQDDPWPEFTVPPPPP